MKLKLQSLLADLVIAQVAGGSIALSGWEKVDVGHLLFNLLRSN
jgi:hypothetical protein